MDSQAQPQPSNEVVAGRYALTKLLARGGIGEVFAAHDHSLGRDVALKRLRHDLPRERAAVVSLMREFRTLSELRHPRIVEVYDYGVDRERPYYTMELLDGKDLRDLSPLPYREACLHLRDVASALALMHARRLLHRDVSPRNVRRTSSGRCKLIDFGAMVTFGLPPNVTGTPPCLAPEAFQGAGLDQRSDLYSLGALAYFVLTGRHCYEVNKLEELADAWAGQVVRAKERVPELPEALDDLVMSLLHLDPTMRPKSPAEVIEWLSAIAELERDDAVSVARGFLISSRLCGRAAVGDELTRSLQRACQGSGSGTVIVGAAGSGKTRMLAEAATIAQTSGLTTVRVTARRQRGSAFALAEDLVNALRMTLPLEAARAGVEQVVWPQHAAAAAPEHVTAAGREHAAEQRARSQQALSDVFCHVARARPLLLAVDDFEDADEFAASLIAGLVLRAATLPLAILVTETEGRASTTLTRGTAQVLQLANLNLNETGALLLSMFGQVPNLERLKAWMFRVARGNPKQTMELAEHLMHLGLIGYVDGTWLLPTDDIDDVVPQTMADSWSQRIRALSEAALALAELLSVRRAGASAALCLAAQTDAARADQIFAALDELVRAGVLESAGDEYAFPQDALRQMLERGLSPERAAALHARWAEVLLAESSTSSDAQLEAGWHLVHTADELRGADILVRVTLPLVEQGIALQNAVPALERALAVYERRRRPLDICLKIRSRLVLAGYLYDYRLARRYGQETLVMLSEISGMRLAKRLRRYLPRALALLLAMFFVSVRRLWLPAERRGPPVLESISCLVRCAGGLLGVRATGLDGPGCQAILEEIAPLEAAPSWTSGPIIYRMGQVLVLQTSGREADLNRAVQRGLFMARSGRKRDMSEVEHQALLVGFLLVDGINECYRERSQALARADALDKLGTRLAEAAALRIRMIYHARRGDSEGAERFRALLDLHATQSGHTWQVEWFASSAEGMSGGAWSDMVAMRRALDRLERLVEEVPTLMPTRDGILIVYCFRRGEFARAVALGERFVADHPPCTLIGWGATYAIVALALSEVGRPQQARELCERALAHVSEEDRAYFAMYDALRVAHAVSLALLGQRQRAESMLDELFERRRAQGEHAILVGLYQYRARMARLLGDRAALVASLQEMRSAALSSGFLAVILLADRTAEQRAKHDSVASPATLEREAPLRLPVAEHTAVSVFLSSLDASGERTRSALHVLARWVAADQAYLYAQIGDSLQLIAALHDERAPSPLLRDEVRVVLCRQAPANDVVELELPVAGRSIGQCQRYRVARLTSDRAAEGLVGAVVLRDCDELLHGFPEGLLADMGRALADDLRARRVTAAAKSSP